MIGEVSGRPVAGPRLRALAVSTTRLLTACVLTGSVLAGSVLTGCGPSLYAFQSIPASSAVASAEQAGAAQGAPYAYWTARAYLDKAAEEANEGNYSDATRFAERAREMGQRAQQQTAAGSREGRVVP